MKIGFLLLRDTFLKTMGSLIEASVNRDHQVLLLFTEDPIHGNKAYQRMTREKLPQFLRQSVETVPILLKDLGMVKEKNQLDVLVTLEGYYMLNDYLAEIQEARGNGVKVVSLSHFYENAMRLLESLDYFDKTYYLSQFAVDIHFELNGGGSVDQLKEKYAGKYEAMGSPMFDQLKNIDRRRMRVEFGIPPGKRVVLFFAPAISAETRWRFLVWGQGGKIKHIKQAVKEGYWSVIPDAIFVPSLEEVLEELRQFCERNNAFLVIKSRAKQRDSMYFQEKADLYLSGEGDRYYPVFTGYELLAIADVCIGVMSMSALEAAAMQVPVWNIYVPSAELEYPTNPLYPRQKQFYRMIMGKEKEGPFNYPGVLNNIEPRNIRQWFRESSLDDAAIDPKAAARYAERYLGFSDKASSDRILDSLEELHASRALKAKVPGVVPPRTQ